jgi:LysR family transcriptional regulator, transcriptional activator of the cysJI operon
MQIQSLKVYCDLAETRSFTKAAALNGVTQSAVSQTIGALERLFKSLLIERSKRKFRLTREGEVVYEHAKKILGLHSSLEHRMEQVRDLISGNLRVSSIYSIGLHDLPPYITKFLQSYPTVNVHVEYRRANEVYEDVQGNVVDLGLVAYPSKAVGVDIVPLRKDPLVLICHPQHPLARLKVVKLKALAGQKFVNFETDIPTRKALDRIFRDRGVGVVGVMEFDNIETVKRAVEIDSGVSIVPVVTVKDEVANGALAAVPFVETGLERPLAAIYKNNKALSPAMKQFITVLKGPL